MDISRRAILALAAGGIVVALKPDNPLVGGVSLARAQIQSPNFVTGSVGWVIRQDGSAEFNNVIIRGGTTIGGTSLWYNGAPALGNLIASDSGTAGTDSLGNAYLSGETGYSHVGGVFYAVQSGGSGTVAATNYYTASSAAGPYTLQASISASSSGLQINSQSGIVMGTAGSGGAVAASLSSGLSGGMPVTQLNRTALSVGNSTTATDLTNTWTINAHDADNGAKYTIETFVTFTTGNTATETLTIGLDLNAGTLVPLATLGATYNGSALNTTYDIPVRLTIVPGAGSVAANAQITLNAVIGDTSANRLPANSAVLSGHSNTTAFTTTSSNTVAVYVQHGGTGGTGQSASANWSEFTRSGQN